MKIPFNKPSIVGRELTNIISAVDSGQLSGDGQFTRSCWQKANPETDWGDVYEAKEALGGFVVAGCDTASIFELVEAPLDQVPQGI